MTLPDETEPVDLPVLIDQPELALTLAQTVEETEPKYAIPVGDGEHAFLIEEFNAIDLWILLIEYSPWWGAGLVAIASIWLILRWRAVRARPEAPGEPHCRSCGYQLTGRAADRCPECGAERQRIGRTRRRRFALPVLTILVVGIGYTIWMTLAPRVDLAWQYSWPSRFAARWVYTLGIDSYLETSGDWSDITLLTLDTDPKQIRLTRYEAWRAQIAHGPNKLAVWCGGNSGSIFGSLRSDDTVYDIGRVWDGRSGEKTHQIKVANPWHSVDLIDRLSSTSSGGSNAYDPHGPYVPYLTASKQELIRPGTNSHGWQK